MADTLFYFLSAFTLIFALGAVFNPKVVNAAMCFLLSLIGVAGLFALLEAYLLAVLLVIIYAGAVVALFLFIIMLIDPQHPGGRRMKWPSLVAAVIAAALLIGALSAYATHGRLAALPVAEVPATGASLKGYAYALFTTYLLPVEVIGFLLLSAMLGVIVLSKKFEPKEDAA